MFMKYVQREKFLLVDKVIFKSPTVHSTTFHSFIAEAHSKIDNLSNIMYHSTAAIMLHLEYC